MNTMLLGCSTVSITDADSGRNLTKVKKWDNEPVSVNVITLREYRYTSSGGTVSPALAMLAQSTGQQLSEKQYGLASRTLHPEFYEPLPSSSARSTRKIIIPGDFKNQLAIALKRGGVTAIGKNYPTIPGYFVRGEFQSWTPRLGLSFPFVLTWDVLMALPSIVAPAPLIRPFKSSLEITLYSADNVKISTRSLQINGQLVIYSIWSLEEGEREITDSLVNAAANITLEMIQEDQKRERAIENEKRIAKLKAYKQDEFEELLFLKEGWSASEPKYGRIGILNSLARKGSTNAYAMGYYDVPVITTHASVGAKKVSICDLVFVEGILKVQRWHGKF